MNRLIIAGALLLLFLVPILGQQGKRVVAAGELRSKLVAPAGSRLQVFELDSRLMRRKIPFQVLLPKGYSDPAFSGRSYPVIYLLHGLFGHFENWTAKTSIANYSEGADFIIVFPECGDGWYTDNLAVPSDKYESYIIQELIPEIDNRFRTIAEGRGRVIAGLSMGGYGAIKFGLKYPDKFAFVGSFSGALGAPTYKSEIPASIGKTIDAVFGPADNDVRKNNDIFAMVGRLTPETKKNVPYIYLSCGTEDLFFKNNREFADLLNQKGIPHEYRELPGSHDWKFWDSQVYEFLQIAERRF
jgi:putative tributyrin esterase